MVIHLIICTFAQTIWTDFIFQYLACLSTSSSNDKLSFDVGLQEHSQGEACWWTVHPASKQRSEGEKVRVGDDLILVSVATERYLVCLMIHTFVFWICYMEWILSYRFICAAHNQREWPIDCECKLPRHALVGAAIRNGYFTYEICWFCFWWRCFALLSWRRRMPYDTGYMDKGHRTKVSNCHWSSINEWINQ